MRLTEIFPSQLLMVAPSAMAGGPPSEVTNFRVAPQEMTNWCWAAVTASVVAYLAPDNSGKWTQCTIASAELDDQCCPKPRPSTCNSTNILDRPLDRVGHLREPQIDNWIKPSAVAAELHEDLPLPIRVGWNNGHGGGHFLSIFGIRMNNGKVELAVTDPIFGESPIMFDALIGGGYQSAGGRWTHTYVVER